jgi:hypothetical protein
MTRGVFKRKLKSGICWGYSFFAGWGKAGKRIQRYVSGFPTKGTAITPQVAWRHWHLDGERAAAGVGVRRGPAGDPVGRSGCACPRSLCHIGLKQHPLFF